MKNQRYKKQFKEGTWAVPSNITQYDDFIADIEALKNKWYNIVGDDATFDGLDQAIMRIEELKTLY
jgi:hypothetical protein